MRQGGAAGFSLRVLLVAFIAVLLVLVLAATTWFSASRFGTYLQDELRIQAQDTATALGVSVSALESEGQVRRLLDAVFDSGAYTLIELRGAEGEMRHQRSVEGGPPPVPGWFRQWADLPAPVGHASVVSGWEPAGSVRVRGDPVPALVRLWHSFLVDLAWSGVLLLVALWLAWRGAGRLLAPLQQMEGQAHALEQGDFGARTEPPRSRELARVARALNDMARRLGETFERQLGLISELEHRANRDPLTGLRTREAFDQALGAALHSEEAVPGGVVAILRPLGFRSFNERRGRVRGNAVLTDCGSRLLDFESRHEGVVTARGQGADLLVAATGVDPAEGDAWLQALVEQLSERYSAHAAPDAGVFQAGATTAEATLGVGALLARADQALTTAAASEDPLVFWERSSASMDGAGARLEAVDAALDSGRVGLARQSLQGLQGEPIMTQVLGRLAVAGGWEVAGRFLPYLERAGRTPVFDRLVIEQVLQRDEQSPQGDVVVTLGLASLVDDAFMHWLAMRLEAVGEQSRSLWLAVPERALRVQSSAVALLADTASRTGVNLMVDHFGAGGLSFGYLGQYAIQGVRISREYVRDLHQRPDARFFLSSIVPVLREQGIRVFASGVEVEAEWAVLRELPVDGVMGFYFSRPEEPEEDA